MPGRLDRYNSKRDFARTLEPRGQSKPDRTSEHRYVIQKHAARRLHYDLRLELDGVFKSWAVTRGPSLNPNDKRLAVESRIIRFRTATSRGLSPRDNTAAVRCSFGIEGTGDPNPRKRRHKASRRANSNSHWTA